MSSHVLDNNKGGLRNKVQSFGRFLSGMVMPNMGAFIAWGLITALFIETGWLPNATLAVLVGPIINYLLPILIGYTGGKTVYGVRGGVVGAVATMGVIAGSTIPMFLGAMIVGPLGGFLIKKFDKLIEGRIKAGFEMLVNNFSSGIIAGILAGVSLVVIGPAVNAGSAVLGSGVSVLVNAGLIPLAAMLIEPAKILFLNNAINHGVLDPLALAEAAKVGKSILFLLETNPGPGLGILLAFWAFAKGTVKNSAPGAIIIHFLGGIHEIYFPYILMKPILLVAVIAGGLAGDFTFSILGAGLVFMTPKGVGNFAAVIAGVLVSTAVSFLVAAFFLKRDKGTFSEVDLQLAAEATAQNKGTALNKAVAGATTGTPVKITAALSNVREIIFACDAGMGSSAMGATTLKKQLEKAGLNIPVVHKAVDEIPSDAQVVVTHEGLTERARRKAPNALHYSIKNFLSAQEYERLVEMLKK